ncbi:hypothetical protein CWI38_0367p0020 [Hamiltosporidium tvaerminnensis]|uniref:Uncharacterized protein n=1 Tax=Hamiltosporidium tvaerminnensis TaxID=1176355 RepID=A0A4Q9LZD9_9MICR|nr:hypothetical protein CWI38_0367p0020 [Hamiltosporidium tvaerminnensis]
MGELLLITNIEDDIIFKKEFDIMNDKEYCSLFMLGYSSLDIIEEIRFSTVKTFFKSLDTQSKWDVSVYFLPSGFKLIYINEDSEEKRVYDFMSKVHILLRKKMLEIDVQKPEVFNCEILLSADISVSINQYGNGNNTASPFYRLAKFTDVKRPNNKIQCMLVVKSVWDFGEKFEQYLHATILMVENNKKNSTFTDNRGFKKQLANFYSEIEKRRLLSKLYNEENISGDIKPRDKFFLYPDRNVFLEEEKAFSTQPFA